MVLAIGAQRDRVGGGDLLCWKFLPTFIASCRAVDLKIEINLRVVFGSVRAHLSPVLF